MMPQRIKVDDEDDDERFHVVWAHWWDDGCDMPGAGARCIASRRTLAEAVTDCWQAELDALAGGWGEGRGYITTLDGGRVQLDSAGRPERAALLAN